MYRMLQCLGQVVLSSVSAMLIPDASGKARSRAAARAFSALHACHLASCSLPRTAKEEGIRGYLLRQVAPAEEVFGIWHAWGQAA